MSSIMRPAETLRVRGQAGVHVVRGGQIRPMARALPCSVETGWSRPENWKRGVMVTTAVRHRGHLGCVNVDRTIPQARRGRDVHTVHRNSMS